jgi:AraC-like DNA-binding protein
MSLKRRQTPEDEPFFIIRTLQARFADGQKLEAHTHDWGQLIYCAEGVASVWTEQGSWVAPPQWAVWAPGGVAHAMRFTGAASLATLYLRPASPAPTCASSTTTPTPTASPPCSSLPCSSAVISVSPLLRELIMRAVEIGMLDEREPTHRAMAELIVAELRTRPTPALDLPLPQSSLLRRVAEWIAQTPDDRLGHAGLAKRFGAGARTLERGFLSETGLSLGQWRRQARLMQALRALGAGASVKQAAGAAGFQSASAFIAAFRSRFNTTPARYFDRA